MKKFVSVAIIFAMLVTSLVFLTVSTSAEAVDLPANTVIINLNAKDTDATIEWQGTLYNVTYGTNYFNTLNGGRDKITAGGTMLLLPGSYPAFAPGKSITMKGAKAGIDPNVRGASKTDDWTLNPARSTDAATESVFTGAIYLTTGGDAVLGSPIHLTIDGIVMNNAYFRSLNFNACEQNLTLKNTILANPSSVSMLYSSAGGANAKNLDTNLCKRSFTIENHRILSKGSISSFFPELTADYFMASGVYIASAATASFIESIYTSSNNDNLNPTYTIRDSMFCQPARVFNLSFRNAARSALMAAQATKESITVTIDDCVFREVGYSGKSIQPQPNNANTTFVLTNNIFYQTNTVNGYYPIADFANSTFNYRCVIDNNEFHNMGAIANINYTTSPVSITRSLYINNGVVQTKLVGYNKVSFDTFYLDAEKTVLRYKNNDCVTFQGVQTSEVVDGKVNLRLIVSLDDLDYVKAGMVITVKEGAEGAEKSVNHPVTAVYRSILGSNEHGILEYTAQDLGGDYLMAIIISDIPADVAEWIFTVKPYAQTDELVTIDSTKYQIVMRNGTVVSQDITAAE